MKFRRVQVDGTPQVEARDGQRWVRLADIEALDEIADRRDIAGDPRADILAVLQFGPEGWAALQSLLRAAPPAPGNDGVMLPFAPRAYRDFMLYERHVIDATRGYARRFMPGAYRLASLYERLTGKTFARFRPKPIWYRQPIYYFGSPLNFVTEGAAIAWPNFTQALDYELELGCVLARGLYEASPEAAAAAIGGFVVFNDFSARDIQLGEMNSGFGPQKAKNFANAMSAEIVTADEVLPGIDRLRGEVRINDHTVAQCSSAGPQFSLPEALSRVSHGERLHAGEFFGSGTLPGGSGMENGHWLAPGDEITLEIEGIAALRNRIAGG